MTHDPSARCAGTSPAKLGRKAWENDGEGAIGAGIAARAPSACLRARADAQEESNQLHSTVSSLSMYSCGVGTKPFTFLLKTWMLLVLQ